MFKKDCRWLEFNFTVCSASNFMPNSVLSVTKFSPEMLYTCWGFSSNSPEVKLKYGKLICAVSG